MLQVLSEPNLLTANGKQGSFLAGGEYYPFPVVQGSPAEVQRVQLRFEFKEFGSSLGNFIPISAGNDPSPGRT